MKYRSLLPLTLLILGTAPLGAITTSGTMARDETWTPADSPVRITGNLTIPPGVTLRIQPGVTVIFAPNPNRRAEPLEGGGLRITVVGTLQAKGTPEEPIRFRGATEAFDPPGRWDYGKPYDTLAGWNQWEGLIFTDQATDADEDGQTGCVVSHCIFESAYQPLDVGDCDLLVEYSYFHRLGAGGDRGPGVTLQSGRMHHCFIEWSGESALRVTGPATIEYVVVTRGFGNGLNVELPAPEGGWPPRRPYLGNCSFFNLAGAALTGRRVNWPRNTEAWEQTHDYELYHCNVVRCSVGLWLDSEEYARPFLFNCDFIDTGWPRPLGAIYLARRDGASPPQQVILFGEGTECRILSSLKVNDAIGGTHFVLPDVWWGTAQPNVGDGTAFVGAGTTFDLTPASTDPHADDWNFQGIVQDAHGRPVAEALVWIEDGNVAATYTDGNGFYRIEGVQDGEYELFAYKPGLGRVQRHTPWILENRPIVTDLRLPGVQR